MLYTLLACRKIWATAFWLVTCTHAFRNCRLNSDSFAHHPQDKEERERRQRLTQKRRQRWRELSAAEKELDWQRYGKYDALQQLLQSAADDPSFKVLPLRELCLEEGTVHGLPQDLCPCLCWASMSLGGLPRGV